MAHPGMDMAIRDETDADAVAFKAGERVRVTQ